MSIIKEKLDMTENRYPQTDGQTERRTDGPTGRQTDRQTDRYVVYVLFQAMKESEKTLRSQTNRSLRFVRLT